MFTVFTDASVSEGARAAAVIASGPDIATLSALVIDLDAQPPPPNPLPPDAVLAHRRSEPFAPPPALSTRVVLSTPPAAISYTAEQAAIRTGADAVPASRGKVVIVSDALSVLANLRALLLGRRTLTSVNDRSLHLSLEALAGRARELVLCWVPAHQQLGVLGNAWADAAARPAHSNPPPPKSTMVGLEFSGDHYALGLQLAGVRRSHKRELFNRLWNSPSISRSRARRREVFSAAFCPPQALSHELFRFMTRASTLHCRLRAHLTRIAIAQDAGCRFCSAADETIPHVVYDCPALAHQLRHIRVDADDDAMVDLHLQMLDLEDGAPSISCSPRSPKVFHAHRRILLPPG